MSSSVCYSVIIPVFNEEPVIQETHARLKEVMDSTGESYELVFVNDGSSDKTIQILMQLSSRDKNIKIINFSRNFGHQIAITAGMEHASGSAVVVIDADLQDPPKVILDMIAKWKQGYEVVYGERSKREGETAFKKLTAVFFYRFLQRMTSVSIPMDVGDFRLIDRKVCNAMKSIHEKNRFVRGLVSWVGFNQTSVSYVREERWAGTTKYPLKKMVRFALDAITSFSHKPLKCATMLGAVVSLCGLFYLLYVLCQRYFIGTPVEGWMVLIVLTFVLNGITLCMLGIVGEYIGRIYDEAKDRPLYIVKDFVNFEDP